MSAPIPASGIAVQREPDKARRVCSLKKEGRRKGLTSRGKDSEDKQHTHAIWQMLCHGGNGEGLAVQVPCATGLMRYLGGPL